MTSEQWNEKWWELYRAYTKAGKDPMAAFKAAHDRMLRVFGPEPKGPEKAGPPFWLKLLAPLAGVPSDMFTKIWDWLNGKKTIIGAVITALAWAAANAGVVLSTLGLDAILVGKVVGVITLVVGIAHKVYKLIYGEEHP